jgi:hypothetical protein
MADSSTPLRPTCRLIRRIHAAPSLSQTSAWGTPARAAISCRQPLSPTEDPRHVELLAMEADLHADARYRLRAGSAVNIGRPWMDGSRADHLLVSLPYPYGGRSKRANSASVMSGSCGWCRSPRPKRV